MEKIPKLERRAALSRFIRTGNFETRDLGITSPTVTQTASVIVQAQFYRDLIRAMKAYDALFSPDVVTFVSSSNGSQMLAPTIDDTANAATVVAEAVQDTETDPTTGGVLVPTASNWRTGMVKLSLELLQDAAFDPADFLARSFAIRLARGIGASIVATALAGAQSGATAASKTAIAISDVINLLATVDPAYLSGPKSGIAMSWTTLFQILGGLVTANQAQAALMAAKEMLGLPIFICPSLPAAGSTTVPVIAGDFGYLVTRTVEGGTNLARYDELYATSGQVGFRGFLRASSALGVPAALRKLTCPA
ncbi:MAG: phage major capsid protein [Terriglobia bacterium]